MRRFPLDGVTGPRNNRQLPLAATADMVAEYPRARVERVPTALTVLGKMRMSYSIGRKRLAVPSMRQKNTTSRPWATRRKP